MNGTVPSTGPNPSSTPGLGLTPSLVALVLANLWPLVGVILLSWTVFAVLFLFWLENVVVGLFNVGRMWMANGPSEKAGASKATLIPFFMVHYGMFAAVHGLLVIALFGGDPGAMLLSPTLVTRTIADTGVWPAALALTASHGFSFVVNYLLGGEFRTTSLETAMVQPYARVVVLHLVILIGGFLVAALGQPTVALALLVLLKIGIDAVAHERQHGRLPAARGLDPALGVRDGEPDSGRTPADR
ncbi:MAG: DUF6498-containing protein [Gemmatimonadota bacterium]|nr:DUF6498-containing protein [Gemmatimonadota bacterium]MDH4351326.1 DUF6498-containing protein [Gemmatimonadota bacterium]MDH5198961.1 DUF6498-containing protein [Gemmatimonadota bacterium]